MHAFDARSRRSPQQFHGAVRPPSRQTADASRRRTARMAMLISVASLALHAGPHAAARRPLAIRCCSDQGPSPDEWRNFRANLIASGLKTTDDGSAVSDAAEPSLRSTVAPANEELLRRQNAAMWEEYVNGAWAHVAPGPEAGGLVCRMPLQAQLISQMRRGAGTSIWGDLLAERLAAEVPDAEASEEARPPAASADKADDASPPPKPTGKSELLESWSANTVYMYRLAERLIEESLRGVAAKASESGKVSWSSISEEQVPALPSPRRLRSPPRAIPRVPHRPWPRPAFAPRSHARRRLLRSASSSRSTRRRKTRGRRSPS